MNMIMLLAGVVVIVVMLVYTYVTSHRSDQRTAGAINVANANATSVQQLRSLIDQVCRPVQNNSNTKKQIQSQDPNAVQVCEQAQRGQLPTPVVTGPKGDTGRGVSNTMITLAGTGCFRVTTIYTDGQSTTSEQICAPSGAPGATGSPGVRGSTGPYPPCFFTPEQCVGPTGKDGVDGINGKNGIGIEKVDCVDETALTIWFDGEDPNGAGHSLGDNTCGQGPKGDKGDKGDPGPQCPDGYTGTPAPQLDGSSVYECVSPAPTTPSPQPTPTQ